MKSFIRAITIIIVLTLIPAVSALAQITPAPAPAPIPAPDSNDVLIQLRTLLSATNQQPGGGKVLVIPTEQIKPQDMVSLMEDMTVMCRIFNQKLAQSNLIQEMPFVGRMMSYSGPFSLDSQSMRAMYIQGYGTLFMTTVDFPLSPPPQAEEQEKTETEETDPLWEQMKQEIFLPHGDIMRAPVQPEEKYDPKKVENLKSTLIKALVHAANIRGLQPQESVIITVTGEAGRSDSLITQVLSSGGNQLILTAPGDAKTGSMSPTVLTIRAKKSYIDALAQNKIDYDEFEEKIQLISYPRLGAATSHSPYGSFSAGSSVGARSSGVNTMVPSNGR
jgi:hypothetical protein